MDTCSHLEREHDDVKSLGTRLHLVTKTWTRINVVTSNIKVNIHAVTMNMTKCNY